MGLALGFGAGTLVPMSGSAHYRHVADLPDTKGEAALMVTMVTQVREDQVELIGCPVGPAYGPVIYNITDSKFAEAELTAGDYVPIYYVWNKDKNAEYGGTYQFVGWASQEPGDDDATEE
jgi:hypothetical protein